MIVDHWLTGAERVEIEGGNEMPVRRLAVIHFTSGASALSSVNYWRSKDADGRCAHVIIERTGKVFQCRPFNRTCGHAGVSRWKDPKTGARYESLNSCSIGIELANAGHDPGALAWARKLPHTLTVPARHQNGGPMREWETYPQPQLSACVEVCKAIVRRYNLDDLTGHDCISPERKDDPGPCFPMVIVRGLCGFPGLPVVHRA